MPNQLQFIKRVLYQLKHRYGTQLRYVRAIPDTTNAETGAITQTVESFIVRKAILLPSSTSRSFSYDLSFIAANKNFTYGGTFDKKSRQIIVQAPFPLVPDVDDTIFHGGDRYTVKQSDELDYHQGYLITVLAVEGDAAGFVFRRTLAQTLTITQTASSVIQ